MIRRCGPGAGTDTSVALSLLRNGRQTERLPSTWGLLMDFRNLAWLFVAGLALHNLEEAIWLPAWSVNAAPWHPPVAPFQFGVAVVALTVAAAASVLLVRLGGRRSLGAYLVTGYALAMLLNVAFPHLLATIALRSYMPGTATAVLFNLPVTALLVRAAFREGYVERRKLLWAGPLVVGGLMLAIPVLLAAGAEIERLLEA